MGSWGDGELRAYGLANGIPLEFTESRYCGERYVFDIELHRQGGRASHEEAG